MLHPCFPACTRVEISAGPPYGRNDDHSLVDDLPSAYIARSKLESAGIPCFLADEYMVGMNCLYSLLVRGVDLRVPAAEADLARELLTEDPRRLETDLADREGVPDLEAALLEPEYSCPRCGGADIARYSLKRPLLVLSYLLGGLPMRWRREKLRCRACGKQWREKTDQRAELEKDMTEKEKAHAGMLYDGNYEPGMMAERLHAAEMCQHYNTLPAGDMEGRKTLMRKLLAKTGQEFLIVQPFYCDYGYNIAIGENFFANVHCVILDATKVAFGDNVFIGPNCGFYTAGHPLDVEQRNKGLEYAQPITIGNNVWVGGNALFMPGVTVGDNVVIGAGSVVTRNIPPNVVAVGSPCRVIRELSPEELFPEAARRGELI